MRLNARKNARACSDGSLACSEKFPRIADKTISRTIRGFEKFLLINDIKANISVGVFGFFESSFADL